MFADGGGQVRHTDADAAAGTVAPVTVDACLAMMLHVHLFLKIRPLIITLDSRPGQVRPNIELGMVLLRAGSRSLRSHRS